MKISQSNIQRWIIPSSKIFVIVSTSCYNGTASKAVYLTIYKESSNLGNSNGFVRALNSAGGDWSKADKEYNKLQEIYSTAMVQAITREPKNPSFIGPEMKYRNVIFDTLKILTFDTTLVQDTIKNLVRQTYLKYDTSIVDKRRDVIANTTPPGHELIIKYHRNGRVKERGLTKNNKRNIPNIWKNNQNITRKYLWFYIMLSLLFLC